MLKNSYVSYKFDIKSVVYYLLLKAHLVNNADSKVADS